MSAMPTALDFFRVVVLMLCLPGFVALEVADLSMQDVTLSEHVAIKQQNTATAGGGEKSHVTAGVGSVGELTVTVKTRPEADAGTSATPKLKVCGTAPDEVSQTCGAWQDLLPDSATITAGAETIKTYDGSGMDSVNKVCFKMEEGDVDAWQWQKVTVKSAAKEWVINATAANQDVFATANSDSQEICGAVPSNSSQWLGEAAVNDMVLTIQAAATPNGVLTVEICGATSTCSESCVMACSSPQTLSGGLNGTIDAGEVSVVNKVCLSRPQSASWTWTWTSMNVKSASFNKEWNFDNSGSHAIGASGSDDQNKACNEIELPSTN